MLTTKTLNQQESRSPAAADHRSAFHWQHLSTDRAKRIGDLAIACTLIVFTMPLLAIVALALKLDSPGPVFSRNERLGPGGRCIRVLKLRTTLHEPRSGEVPWLPLAQVTRVGRFLRYTSIGELPQLINVLRGEMTLIGAGQRPLAFLGCGRPVVR
jgi:lipopolysaccharide/colanic/teichoic acid biosynthesis glycosyltransferase